MSAIVKRLQEMTDAPIVMHAYDHPIPNGSGFWLGGPWLKPIFDYRGMDVTSGGYPLRPEIVESAYYLHRLTGEPRWRAMGRGFFEDFVRRCRTDAGHAAIKDVRTMEQRDSMESFLFAETFKYYWLLFAPASALDFQGIVFNTEAHPLRRTWKD